MKSINFGSDLEDLAELVKPPKYKTGFDRNLWIWEERKQENSYLISADVARGDGKDARRLLPDRL